MRRLAPAAHPHPPRPDRRLGARFRWRRDKPPPPLLVTHIPGQVHVDQTWISRIGQRRRARRDRRRGTVRDGHGTTLTRTTVHRPSTTTSTTWKTVPGASTISYCPGWAEIGST